MRQNEQGRVGLLASPTNLVVTTSAAQSQMTAAMHRASDAVVSVQLLYAHVVNESTDARDACVLDLPASEANEAHILQP